MTVGATAYLDTSDWSDDNMWEGSCWITDDTVFKVEKPEIVAPGCPIKMIGLNGNLYEECGTSFAAPQVAGLGALLIDRNADLFYWPTSIKAIIMASAVHNVEGPRLIVSGQDLKDGAGAIDAALADQVAKTHGANNTTPCSAPCWWGEAFTNVNFPVGTSRNRYFYASQGERIRVAIAWWSKVNCPSESNCSDELGTNLNLYIYDPYSSLLSTSTSTYNNYEIVEFTAPWTGIYRIRSLKTSSTEDQSAINHLGIAVSKDATYLPDIRVDQDGWDSHISIFNRSAEPQDVYITFSNGYNTIWWGLDPNELWQFPVSQLFPSGFYGNATVNVGEDVAVVVATEHPYSYSAYAYNGVTAAGNDPGWGQIGASLYAPSILNNYYSWYSLIVLSNTGASTANVTIKYYSPNGSATTFLHTIAPGEYILANNASGAANTLYSAVITSDQPLAGVVHQYSNNNYETYNLFAIGNELVYAPLILNSYYTWNTSVNIQNLSNSAANISIYYYDVNGNAALPTPTTASIPAYASKSYYSPQSGLPSGFIGSANISSDKPVAVVVNQSSSSRGQSYSGVITGTASIAIPYLMNNYLLNNYVWVSSVNVRNLNATESAYVILTFDGQSVMREVPANGFTSYYLPQEWSGSALGTATVTAVNTLADGPAVDIAVIVNHSVSSPPPGADLAHSYTGINR